MARAPGWVRWAVLGVAAVVVVVFLLAQRHAVDVSYGQSPAARDVIPEGAAGELSAAAVPSAGELAALVRADPVVRLPGAIARWDEKRVADAIGDRDVRILVAPPGLDEAERDRVRTAEGATIRVIGTDVSGGPYAAAGDSSDDWRAQFGTGDVTNQLVALVAGLHGEDAPPDVDPVTWREPTAAELEPVLADLRATGVHRAAGATLTDVPAEAARSAFPDGALYLALPLQPFGEPLPAWGPALAKSFPDKPIVVLYGSWITSTGPHAADFADVVGATFYGRFAERLARYAYPQRAILSAYLNKVTDVRYAGLFDRPLPYRPADPLEVALPALPLVFLACAVTFLALSVRSPRRPTRDGTRRAPARLAGLTALAVEVSALSRDPALTRGIAKLGAARDALAGGVPDRRVAALLDDAQSELDHTARALGRPEYRPDAYLAGGPA
ncbi:hypothetical protein [Actinosynnema sp. NPDC020468]|uniref:hypothetical protein n=1 Tax=Actinosynnema sp. NPDC020468 TaxID=3154488 RepID=UPI0033E5B576